MGQLTSGEEAIGYLTKGIAIMEGGGDGGGKGEACTSGEDVTSEEISTAYCALAEIYLTDVWYRSTCVYCVLCKYPLDYIALKTCTCSQLCRRC